MDEKISGWMGENRKSANTMGLIIEEIDKECSKVEIGGYMIQLSIPDDDCAFAVSLEQEYDEKLMETLVVFNEKLERLKINSDRLNKVLDNLVQVFEKRNCRKPEKQKQAGDEITEPFVCRLAEDARRECEKALIKATESSVVEEILPWCSVRPFQEMEKIELQIELKGIMSEDHVTRALGFCFDHPLVLHLNFSSDKWRARKFSVDNFRHLEVSIRQTSAKAQETMDVILKVVDEENEKLKTAAINSCSNFKQYGPHYLVPQFVKEFFNKCEIGCDGVVYSRVREQVAESNNIIAALLISLGNWMKNLKKWCVICGQELPPFSRLWYCDEELCLFSFEELSYGASVLQELQNSELIDLELTLAAAAAKSSANRDVFEPYPAFLLKKEELRKRSGFFSSCKHGVGPREWSCENSNVERKHLSNKNIELLRELIDSFPPLSQMQQCSNELELVLKLGMSWLKNNSNSANLSEEDYGENLRLPYKILTYIVFTNRLSLHPLQQSCRLNVGIGCLYQFAVFYNYDKEKIFEQRRKSEGSVFAFHGSSLSNWYSIIRNGLRCLSKTQYMTSGSQFGDGIYFSPQMNCSINYSASLPLTMHGIRKEYSVIAICEILSGEKHSRPPHYVVGPEYESDVVIRYLLVLTPTLDIANGSVTEGHILTDSGERLDLYKHYKNLRKQYVEEISNGGMVSKNQISQLFQKRQATTQSS